MASYLTWHLLTISVTIICFLLYQLNYMPSPKLSMSGINAVVVQMPLVIPPSLPTKFKHQQSVRVSSRLCHQCDFCDFCDRQASRGTYIFQIYRRLQKHLDWIGSDHSCWPRDTQELLLMDLILLNRSTGCLTSICVVWIKFYSFINVTCRCYIQNVNLVKWVHDISLKI